MSENQNFVYGLSGIMELFKCSKSKAQKLKRTTLAPAILQDGRKIMINKAEALELVRQNTART